MSWKTLGVRTFHLRDPRSTTGRTSFSIELRTRSKEVSIHPDIPSDVRKANPELRKLYALLDVAKMLSVGSSALMPGSTHPLPPEAKPLAKLVEAVARSTSAALKDIETWPEATAAVRSTEKRLGLAYAASACARAAADDLAHRLFEDVLSPRLRTQVKDLTHVLIGEEYLADGLPRDRFSVGRDVLRLLSESGVHLSGSVGPGPYDCVAAFVMLSKGPEVLDYRYGPLNGRNPSFIPSVAAWVLWERQVRDAPTVDGEYEEIRETFKSVEDAKLREAAAHSVEAWNKFRDTLARMLGDQALERFLAIPGVDSQDASPGATF